MTKQQSKVPILQKKIFSYFLITRLMLFNRIKLNNRFVDSFFALFKAFFLKKYLVILYKIFFQKEKIIPFKPLPRFKGLNRKSFLKKTYG
jgi:hypothetical protein